MASVQIIGAGISGPTAALILARLGHNVTVYERRSETALRSPGILGITESNWQELTSHGVTMADLPNWFTDYATGKTNRSEYRYITWTDLHDALVNAARKAGANFRFSTEAPITNDEIVINAAGVGYAAKVGTPHYSGYIVIRGLSPAMADTSWTTVHGYSYSGKWLFNVGDTLDGASFAFYVHRRNLTEFKTRTTTEVPGETSALPPEFARIVASTPEFQIAPISDWDVPENLRNAKGWTIGDANGAMRPHTSMGANLGIREALSLGFLMSGYFEKSLIGDRKFEHARGIRLGNLHMGE